MSAIKLTEKQMDKIFNECDIDEFEYDSVIHSEWINEDKYDTCDTIFLKDGKYYRFEVYRRGNYWNGYEFDFYDNEAIEVEKVKVVKEVWLPKVTIREMKTK